jgi:hypothetical protein
MRHVECGTFGPFTCRPKSTLCLPSIDHPDLTQSPPVFPIATATMTVVHTSSPTDQSIIMGF